MTMDARQFSSDKILKHLDRVNAWILGNNPAPITVELDMTNICNHKCPECSGSYFQERGRDYLPYDLAKKIIKQLAMLKVRGLIFTGGGEPLCHPQINKVVELAHSSGMDIGFITNGSLITEEIARILLNTCTWIRFSLDAACAETFKRVHGLDGNAFQKVVNNIRLLVEMKKRLNSRITIGVGFLTCDYTRHGMLDAAKLCRGLGVDYLQFRPMQMHRNGRFKYHLADISKNIDHCMKENGDGFKILCSKHKYEMMADTKYGRNYEKCYGHQFATVIAADAKMYLCCHMRGYGKYCIGDLRRNTLEEIWNSSRRKKIVGNIDFKDCVPLCRDNTFNQILWNIRQRREHENFL